MDKQQAEGSAPSPHKEKPSSNTKRVSKEPMKQSTSTASGEAKRKRVTEGVSGNEINTARKRAADGPPNDQTKKRKLDTGKPSTQHRPESSTALRIAKPLGRATNEPREPSPPPRSPPRKLKRPTARAALSQAELEAIKKRREEREQREQAQRRPEEGVGEFVKQHYNAVPQRDRNWRKTDSKIKGLRAFNNWVKSCLIRKFTPQHAGVTVLDMGCGKGGDLQKWKSQRISHYIGLDIADISIGQAWERYRGMARHGGGRFQASFHVFDCYSKSLQAVDQVRDVGFDAHLDPRWSNGGFDVVTMMFCMHYSFESEAKARTMLSNVAGALKKGGTFIGVIPNSDVLVEKIQEHYRQKQPAEAAQPAAEDDDDDWDPEKSVEEQEKEKTAANGGQDHAPETDEIIEWGNSIYHVKFPGHPPKDGVFRPPFGWKYFFFLEEAVEEVPEYVVPWGVFRG